MVPTAYGREAARRSALTSDGGRGFDSPRLHASPALPRQRQVVEAAERKGRATNPARAILPTVKRTLLILVLLALILAALFCAGWKWEDVPLGNIVWGD